jgi:hypothetical protein
MSKTKQTKQRRCAVPTGSLSVPYVKIRKFRGSAVPSHYVACFDSGGKCVRILEPEDAHGWWTKKEATDAGRAWMREQAKPTENKPDSATSRSDVVL